MQRMRKALVAMKMAEMSRLGAMSARAAGARATAQRLRQNARDHGPCATVAEMRELSIWQALSEANARAAEAEARAIETEMEPLKEQLARTLGRESVTETLIAAAERAALTDLERRREDAPKKSVRLGAGS